MAKGIRDTDKGYKAIRAELERAKGLKCVVGWIAGSQGSEGHEGGLTNLELAGIHEYGSPSRGIPERAPVRRTFEARRGDLAKLAGRLGKEIVRGKMKAEQALGLLGARFAADVKGFIASGSATPENAPATVARKGSSTPLVDTGRLLGSITWAVRPKGGAA